VVVDIERSQNNESATIARIGVKQSTSACFVCSSGARNQFLATTIAYSVTQFIPKPSTMLAVKQDRRVFSRNLGFQFWINRTDRVLRLLALPMKRDFYNSGGTSEGGCDKQ
jgi:hypothetical protein